jgi:hypothetical protein
MTFFRDFTPCSLLQVWRRFRGAYCLHHHRPDDEGSKHLSNVGQFLPDYRRNVPEDSHLHTHRCEKLKSQHQITYVTFIYFGD